MEEKTKAKGSIDELALVKAAAWAWYQRGSGADGMVPFREYDLSTAHERFPKPSRYKREAMRESKSGESSQENGSVNFLMSSPLLSPLSSEHTDISLLDAYEIQRISRQLDLYIESSRADFYRRCLGGFDLRGRRKAAGFASESGKDEKRFKEKNDNSNGFWLVLCGSSRHDVIEGRRVSVGGRSRWPEKQGMVVKGVGRRPRP